VLARRGAGTLSLQVLQLSASIAIAILVTRVTGAHGKGIYTLVATLVTLTTMVTGLGLGGAAVYFIGSRRVQAESIVGNLLVLTAVLTTFGIVALGLAFLVFRSSGFSAFGASQLWLALGILPLVQITTVMAWILLGFNYPVRFATVTLIQVWVTLVVQCTLALVGRLDTTTALLAWLVGGGASVLAAVYLVARLVAIRFRVEREQMRNLLGFGVRTYVANLFQFFNYRLDALLVSFLLGVTSLGYYSVAVAMGEVIWYPANAASLTLFPQVAKLPRTEAGRVSSIVCRNTLFLTLTGSVVMFFAAPLLIRLAFSSSMLAAVDPLRLLLPGIVALSVAKVVSSYLNGIGKPVYAMYLGFSTFFLTLALDLGLIPIFGIRGAAAASSIVYIVLAAGILFFFLRESGNGLIGTLVVQPSDFIRYRRFVTGLIRMARRRPTPPTPARNTRNSGGE
jgi:O-antigen/teichoic acid export membrane protein